MVLARGGLLREGAEGKDRYPRTQQASQNATRGHHTQTQDPEGLLWGHTFSGCAAPFAEPRARRFAAVPLHGNEARLRQLRHVSGN